MFCTAMTIDIQSYHFRYYCLMIKSWYFPIMKCPTISMLHSILFYFRLHCKGSNSEKVQKCSFPWILFCTLPVNKDKSTQRSVACKNKTNTNTHFINIDTFFVMILWRVCSRTQFRCFSVDDTISSSQFYRRFIGFETHAGNTRGVRQRWEKYGQISVYCLKDDAQSVWMSGIRQSFNSPAPCQEHLQNHTLKKNYFGNFPFVFSSSLRMNFHLLTTHDICWPFSSV